MQIITSIQEMQAEAERLRLQGQRIGFVPTMGYLHEGHLSLVRAARQHADVVIMSIFVNPTQFGPTEDYNEYPRNFERDVALAASVGCHIVFNPTVNDIYPENYLTYVEVEKITGVLCGRSRPTHFRGVTTIVAKLFHIVKPHVAVFGQKDAQQALVIQRMVRDLNFDIQIVIAPIVREKDGLAMSSRNIYLTPEQRQQAVALYQALMMAKSLIEKGERNAQVIKDHMRRHIERLAAATIDYIEIVDTTHLQPLAVLQGEVLIALAVKIGKPRLIDNIIVTL
jgi:pantoate--beta-alanine ligase